VNTVNFIADCVGALPAEVNAVSFSLTDATMPQREHR
jgi:hypothetical protein